MCRSPSSVTGQTALRWDTRVAATAAMLAGVMDTATRRDCGRCVLGPEDWWLAETTLGARGRAPTGSRCRDSVGRAQTHSGSAPHLLRTDRRAEEREDERFRDAHDRELDVGVADSIDTPACAHDADPEELGRCLCARGVDLGRLPLVDGREAPVRVVHEHSDALGWRELSGRDEGCRGLEGHPGLTRSSQRL